MRVFVTGGTGFIGRFVVPMLIKQGHHLLVLSRQQNISFPGSSTVNLGILRGDMGNQQEWEEELIKFAPQAAIHLAWEGLPSYTAEISRKNLNDSLALIELLADAKCEKLITTGSCWEYGARNGCLNEYLPPISSNAFTAAKNALYWLGGGAAKERGMAFIWARLFYVYGPGQRETSLIPHIMASVKGGKTPSLKTPQNKNDFVYVQDVAEAIMAILEKVNTDAIYNIGSGYSTSIVDVVKMVCSHFNFRNYYDNLGSSIASVDFWADIARIQKDTGWLPVTSMEEGILEIIHSESNNKQI